MPKKFIIQVMQGKRTVEKITRIIRIETGESLYCLYQKTNYPVMWDDTQKTWKIDTESTKKEIIENG